MQRERHLQQCANYFGTPYVRQWAWGWIYGARRKDKTVFPVEISLGVVETQQGRLALAFIVDITQRNEVEQLREAMVHTMVHDLRSPLGSIMTALQISKWTRSTSSRKATIAGHCPARRGEIARLITRLPSSM
jgi:signal transduction histidine kinase